MDELRCICNPCMTSIGEVYEIYDNSNGCIIATVYDCSIADMLTDFLNNQKA